jgi:pilus assembly protein CpaF
MQKLPKLLPGPDTGAALAVLQGRPSYRQKKAGFGPALSTILQEVQREVAGTVLWDDGDSPAASEIERLIRKAASKFGLELSNFERDEILEHLEREKRPFGILQELVEDPTISDIIITDYTNIGVQQSRKNVSTDLSFPSQESYEAFVEKLLARAGSTYSTKKPIADGMIGSHARIHAVHKCLCDTGPYVTIRLNRFSTVDTRDLINAGLAPSPIFNYLEAIIRSGQTLLIVGEVGTGKTTLVRALANAIPLDQSILVIEDTPEIRLEHPHVRYLSTREANTDGAGKVSPSECIRGGMRMAMNRIIFGEIRDAEAAEAFVDVCASGHPGLSTIHARSGIEALTRLELFLGRAQRGATRAVINEQITTAVHVIVFVTICALTGRRRIAEVQEVGPVADGAIRRREMFRYHVSHGTPQWSVHSKVSAHRDLIEKLKEPVILSSYPSLLGLETEHEYREAVCNGYRSA